MNLRNFIPVIALAILGSCEDKDHVPAPGIGGSMSATIDGSGWAASSVYLNQPSASNFQIIGERTPNPSQSTGIGIASASAVNSYVINSGSSAYYSEDGVLYTATSGQVNVTQSDATWLKGNFSFIAIDSPFTATKTISGNFTYRKQ